MKESDYIIRFWQGVSTVSTGFALKTLVSIGTADQLILNSSLGFGFALGGTMAYKVIPELISAGAKKQALIVGTLLSLTYPMNAPKIFNVAADFKCSEIDKRYKKNVKEYSSYLLASYLQDKTIVELNNKYLLKKRKVESLVEHPISLRKIKNKTTLEIGKIKSSSSSSKYKRYYTNLAKKHGCRLPISAKRLANCVSNVKYNNEKYTLENKISTAKSELEELKIKLDTAVTKDNIAKEKAKNSKLELATLKNSIETTKEKAKNSVVNIWLIVLLLWGFGLFIEVFIVGFEMLKEIWKEKYEETKIGKKVEQVSEELEKVSKEYRKILHNYEGMDAIIDFANKKEHHLRKVLAWKKGNRKGKTIALSNAIMGAFLYALTLRKEEDKSVTSWSEISQADILFVNGRAGTESVNGKKRLKLIDSFLSNVANKNISCLGSTAEKIKIKNFGDICPQKEALNYLVEKEVAIKERFAPQHITVEDMKLLAIDFTKKFYPQQFGKIA